MIYYERFRWDLESLEEKYLNKFLQYKIEAKTKKGKSREKAEDMQQIYERALKQCRFVLSKLL
jgi:hypothetical protein